MKGKNSKKTAIIPRPYQIEALQMALKKNVILCLPTGSGKTFIAISVFNKFGHSLNSPISEGGKRAFFLVPTKVLVYQQAAAIEAYSPYEVGRFSSESRDDFGIQIDNWKKPYWDIIFEKFQVLVMTRKIFLDILNSAYITTSSIATIVFDEVHRGAPNGKGKRTADDYVTIMDTLKVLGHSDIRIIGLTASLINNRWVCDNKMDQVISTIEDIFNASVFFPDCASGTCPKEIIWCYKALEGWDLECQSIPASLRHLAAQISIKKGNGNDDESIPVGILLENDAIPITPKQMKNTFEELARICSAFGPWTLNQSLTFILKSYNLVRAQTGHLNSSFREIIELVIQTLQGFQLAVRNKLDLYEKDKKLFAGVPHKMLRLLVLLYEFNAKPDDSISAIIFVERRLDALALSEWLNAVSETIPEYSFIKSDFIIGSATMAPFPFNSCLRSRQLTIISDFKKQKLNIIVATSVLEEGLDISHCNLIIRYDEPKTFRAYVQSKGRGRSREAYFVFFSSEIEQAMALKNIKMFHLTEERLPHYRQPADPVNVTISFGGEYLKTPTGAVLPKSEAKNRVIFYCDHLPADCYTIKTPKVKTIDVSKNNKLYYCHLKLPKISPLHNLTITGRKCSTKREAETSAYYEAAQILWAHGELDDAFRPLDRQTLLNRALDQYKIKTDRTELKEWEKECAAIKKAWNKKNGKHDKKHNNTNKAIELPPKPGTNKRVRSYPVVYSKILTSYQNMDSPCWLYKVTLTLVTNNESCHFGTLGLIVFNLLPINLLDDKLFIYSTKDKFKVSLELVENSILKEHELKDIRNFQEYIYSDCLKIGLDNERTNSKIFFTDAMAPYHLLFTFLTEKNTIDYTLLKKMYKRRPIIPDDYANLTGALISKNYSQNRKRLWLVEKVDYNLSPRSKFPGPNFDTYEDYYHGTYGVPSLNEGQPLLACYPVSKIIFSPSQPSQLTRKSLKQFKMTHLIPELCQFEYFSNHYMELIYTLPAITAALNQFLLADEIRKQLCTEIGYGQSEVPSNVAMTREHHRFTNFVPLNVEIDNIVISSKLADLPYVTCKRYHEPNAVELTTSTLSSDYSPDEWMEVDDDDEDEDDEDDEDDDEDDDDDDFEEKTCESGVNESTGPELMDSSFIKNEGSAARPTFADPKVYYSNQATIFCEKPSPSISSVPWSDQDINIQKDFMILEKRLADHSSKYTQQPEDNEIETIIFESQLKDFSQENATIIETNSIYQDLSSYKYGLPIEIIIEALTTKKSNPFINLERFEIIGDSFLKYIVSAFLFLKIQDLNEARITWLKMHLISNFNLLHMGRAKGLAQYINNKNFFPRKNWLPPFYSSRHREFTKQEMSDKTIADMVEAMIGAHLICLGEDAAIKFLRWLGMPLSSLNTDCKEMDDMCLTLYDEAVPVENPEKIDKIWKCSSLSQLESKLQYQFKRKDLLIEAMTHPSWYRSQINSYQRLEFLGDAVLDYLITAYIFDHPKLQHLKPGELTHIRQALVNNDYFATVALVNDFHKYMFYASPTLHSAIAEFRQQLINKDLLGCNKIKLGSFLLENLDTLDNEAISETPKALGDIFESIAGAIYLDSGNSLATVWQVYSRFLGNELEFFCANVPKSPVVRLFETFPDSKFIIEKLNDDPKQSRKRLNLIVDGWSFTVNEDELSKEGMNKKKERLSLVLSALNTLVKNKMNQPHTP